jgi:hypothetical protein
MHLCGGDSTTTTLNLLELSIDQSMTSKISGVFAASDWGFCINPCVCLRFFISQGTSGALPIRSMTLQVHIRGPRSDGGFKFVGDL